MENNQLKNTNNLDPFNQEDKDNFLMTELVLREFIEDVSVNTGSRFFEELVLHITKIFNIDYAFIGEIAGESKDKVNIITICSFGELTHNFDYQLLGTASEKVIKEKKPYCCATQVRKIFPNSVILAEKELESYIGIPLLNSAGEIIGILVAMHSKPIPKIGFIKSIFRIYSLRASAEMERLKTEEKLYRMAFHDHLTDLPNRRLFNEQLDLEINRAMMENRMMAIMILDLDRLKLINDTLGHDVGDRLLLRVADSLIKCTDSNTIISRLGGDEFAIILPEINKIEEAENIAARVINNIKQPWLLDGDDLFITTSVGIAIYPKDGNDVKTLLKHADAAMYQAKEQGRNNYQVYNELIDRKNYEQLTIKNNLSRALEREEFILFYQPKVDSNTMKMIGMEALIRWQNPEIGLVPPGQFIPVAEDSWLIIPIGEWVLRQACIENKAWQDAGLKPIPVAVNISSRQFQQYNFVDTVVKILEETRLEPQWLELEITESIAAQNVELTINTLSKLRKMGIQIAIDDFGTGYSSLSYLNRFPINTLKIDQAFIREISANKNDAAIATAIIAMAKSLKLEVIAEGVETEEQLEFLKERQCNKVQGFIFGKPMPSEEFKKILEYQGLTIKYKVNGS